MKNKSAVVVCVPISTLLQHFHVTTKYKKVGDFSTFAVKYSVRNIECKRNAVFDCIKYNSSSVKNACLFLKSPETVCRILKPSS